MTRPERVALVGFMGVGKSATGRALARLLDWPFVDLDGRIVESAGAADVAAIFAAEGESGFRRREAAALDSVLAGSPPLVLAAGGGLYAARRAREALRAAAVTVWLDAPLALLRDRVDEGAGRPLWTADPDALRRLHARRTAVYSLADLRHPAGSGAEGTPDAVARDLARRLAEGRFFR